MQLTDFGATVTKVERPGTGDDTRSWGPPYDERGQATYFQAVNRNKDSIVLDLTDEHDLAEARRLTTGADVVVENFRPGLMAEFGLDYDQLQPANPGLVYCSITGFGRGQGAHHEERRVSAVAASPTRPERMVPTENMARRRALSARSLRTP